MKLLTPNYLVKLYSQNLLRNGNCEKGAVSPSYWTSSGSDATTDNSIFYSGTRAFKVIGGSDYWTSRFKDCEEETEYTFRGYVKTDSATAKVQVLYYNAYGALLDTEDLESFFDTKDWTEYIIKFTTPENCSLFIIKLLCTAGTAYYDFLFVTETYLEIEQFDIESIRVQEREGRAKTATIFVVNKEGKYSDSINTGDYLEIWMGERTNVTKKFAGKISTNPRILNDSGFRLQISAEHGDILFQNDRCNAESYVDKTWDYIIKDLVEKHFDKITVNNVQSYSGNQTVSFSGRKTIQEAFNEIEERSGWIIYLDDNWDLHFEAESLTSSGRTLEEGNNIIFYTIDSDARDIYNAVRVHYGVDLDEVIEYDDKTSIDEHGGRNKGLVDVDWITTEEDAFDYGEAWVNARKDDNFTTGARIMDTWMAELTTKMTVTLVSAKESVSSTYEIKSVSHVLDSNGFYTELELNTLRPTNYTTQADMLRRIEELEEQNTTEPETKTIFLSFEDLRRRADSVVIYTQDRGSSACYSHPAAKYEDGVTKYGSYAEQWEQLLEVSTN